MCNPFTWSTTWGMYMYNSCFFVIVQFKGTYRNYVTFNFYIYHKMFFLISSHMPENLFCVKDEEVVSWYYSIWCCDFWSWLAKPSEDFAVPVPRFVYLNIIFFITSFKFWSKGKSCHYFTWVFLFSIVSSLQIFWTCVS